jgi:hypothetical protein
MEEMRLRGDSGHSLDGRSMKTNKWLSVLVVAGWMIGANAPAQQPAYRPAAPAQIVQTGGYQPAFPAPSPLTPDALPEKTTTSAAPEVGVLSDWIVYRCDNCEGRFGKVTPLYTEIYAHAGPSFPVGGMTLSRELKTGWSFVGGARAMFFNEQYTSAFIVDAHIINTHMTGGAQNTEFPLTITHQGQRVTFGPGATPGATVAEYNRTLFGLGVGRDWYPWQPANSDGCKWRIGVDGGGRYGSGRVAFNEFGHSTDVIGAAYAGMHSKIEFPVRSLIWHVGLRAEWAYTWSDVLQRTSDLQEIGMFLTVGARY